MSKLDELLYRLCPNGVAFSTLGEVCDFITGFAFKASLFKNEGLPVCKTTNIQDSYLDFSGMQFFDKNDYTEDLSKYIIKPQKIVIGMSGTIKIGINNTENECYLNQRVGMFNPHKELNNKFLYYVLCNSIDALIEGVSGGSVKNLSNDDVKSLKIPVPPMEVQCEIVRILDSFTELTAELTAELTTRRKQYEHYKESLINDCSNKIFLRDICTIKGRIGFRGYTTKDLVKQGEGAISLSPSNIKENHLVFENNTYLSWFKYNESPEIMLNIGDVVTVKTGSTVGKIAYVDSLPEKTTLNPQLVVLKNIKCDNKFLYYCLTTNTVQNYIKSNAGLGSVPNISQEKLGNIELRIPSIEKQKEIVYLLDCFYTYSLDTNFGLPAEIEARQKQYEYYRDKLLTFKELEA